MTIKQEFVNQVTNVEPTKKKTKKKKERKRKMKDKVQHLASFSKDHRQLASLELKSYKITLVWKAMPHDRTTKLFPPS